MHLTNQLVDTVPPVITLKGASTITLEASFACYYEPGFSALDAVDGDVTGAMTVSAPANPSFSLTLGSYSIVYTAVDQSGNKATATRTVIVQDTTPPVVTLINSTAMTIPYLYIWVEPGYYAFDHYNGNLTNNVNATISPSGPIDTTLPNTVYTITYVVSDASGNQGTATRTVTIGPVPRIPQCVPGNESSVTSAFLGIIVFIVTIMLFTTLIRQHGLKLIGDYDLDPGTIHGSADFEEDTQ